MKSPHIASLYNWIILVLLAIVLVVIGLNYSKIVSNHEVPINLAGRQCMLTERIHRVLLQLQSPLRQSLLAPHRLGDLDAAARLFNDTLLGFVNGTSTRNSANEQVRIDSVDDPKTRKTLDSALLLWQGYYPLLQAINNHPSPDKVLAAVAYADRHSEQLLGLMNQLTTQLTVHSQAHSPQLIWLEGLSLPLILLLLWWTWSLKHQLSRDRQTHIDSLQQQVSDKTTELQSVTRQMNELMEVSPDLVWEKDTSGIYQYCNLPFETHFGLSREQIIGKTDFDLRTPDQAERHRESDRQSTSARKSTHTEEWLTPASGGDAKLYEIIRSPVWDISGKLTGIQCVGRDITTRRAAETALVAADASRRLLELCIAKLNDVVIITEAEPIDKPGPRIVFVNDAYERVTGYSRAEALGQSPRVLQGPKTQRSELDRIRQALMAWKSIKAELINYKKNGDEYWVEIEIIPVSNAKGWFTHWIGIQRDITARKQAESEMLMMCDRANESSRMKSEFLSSISHEMRTPMNGVLGMAQLLLFTQLTDKQTQYANHILEAATNHMEVIDKVLDFSKLERGKLTIESLPFDLPALIKSLELLTLPKTQSKKLTLHVTTDATLPQHVLGDENRLSQCLLILLDNAVKFTVSGGIELEVRSLPEMDRLHFEVRDTGIGLTYDVNERLFHPFTQGDGSTTRRYSGIGLGLMICRQLVELMQGQMGVESTPGQGSTFWFELPLEGV